MISIPHPVRAAVFAAAFVLSGGCSKEEPLAPPPVDEAPTAAATPQAAPAAEPDSLAAPLAAPPAAPEVTESTAEAPPAGDVTSAGDAGAINPGAPSAVPAQFEPEPWRSLDHEIQTPAVRPPVAASGAEGATAPEQPETGSAPPPPAGTAGTAATTAAKVDGSQIAQAMCIGCHQAGINGAPKFANKVAWAPRIAQGREKLYQNSIEGFRGMPPRGGNPNLTDEQVKAAVDYLIAAAGGYRE